MFKNILWPTGGRIVTCGNAMVPSPVFANFIQGKTLEDFKALPVNECGYSVVETDFSDCNESVEYTTYILIDDEGKVSFSGETSGDLPDDPQEPLDCYSWTTPATIEEINDFKVDLDEK